MPENAVAYTIGHAANNAPPAVMNQTWLPSQCGAIVLIAARRSSSFLPTNGMIAIEPISKPSVRAKPISSTPTSTHQMILSNSYSIMLKPPHWLFSQLQVSRSGIYQYEASLGLDVRI